MSDAAQSMSFEDWMARIEQEMGTDDVDPDAFRDAYEKGLSPAEAVLRDRRVNGVI